MPEEIEAYQPYLSRQIKVINPRVIAPLGRFSMNYFLPEAKITRDQGKLFQRNGRFIYPLFHPAAALRNPEAMRAFRAGVQKLPAVLAKVRQATAEGGPASRGGKAVNEENPMEEESKPGSLF